MRALWKDYCNCTNKDLVVQTERDYKNLGLDVGVFMVIEKSMINPTICTWQSLAVLEKKTKSYEAEIDMDVF